ncbi:hypothetical protein PsorP6_000645 [Peronosclerospora sorghi]|uniref:Uncharacterized protein n=1 Tax=Peronosclerospora sorghi TaxID=230839 RepID=A0ACC0WV00_9STRA|nr:hypothetical protein PsorP6_000645 [Peronosclerospora sorghi]
MPSDSLFLTTIDLLPPQKRVFTEFASDNSKYRKTILTRPLDPRGHFPRCITFHQHIMDGSSSTGGYGTSSSIGSRGMNDAPESPKVPRRQQP